LKLDACQRHKKHSLKAFLGTPCNDGLSRRVIVLSFNETLRELNMECSKVLTEPTVFISPLGRSDPSVFTSLMRESRRTQFKSM